MALINSFFHIPKSGGTLIKDEMVLYFNREGIKKNNINININIIYNILPSTAPILIILPEKVFYDFLKLSNDNINFFENKIPRRIHTKYNYNINSFEKLCKFFILLQKNILFLATDNFLLFRDIENFSKKKIFSFFSIFRCPLERSYSLYSYINSDASKHEKTHHSLIEFKTYVDYSKSNKFEENWVAKRITKNFDPDKEKNINFYLDDFVKNCTIGFLDDLAYSFTMFKHKKFIPFELKISYVNKNPFKKNYKINFSYARPKLNFDLKLFNRAKNIYSNLKNSVLYSSVSHDLSINIISKDPRYQMECNENLKRYIENKKKKIYPIDKINLNNNDLITFTENNCSDPRRGSFLILNIHKDFLNNENKKIITLDNGKKIIQENSKNLIIKDENILLKGNYFYLVTPFIEIYGHMIHDTVFILTYLFTNYNKNIILIKKPKIYTYLEIFFNDIFKNIIWITPDSTLKINGNLFYFFNSDPDSEYPEMRRDEKFTNSFLNLISKSPVVQKYESKIQPKRIIYLSRPANNNSLKHGRIMNDENKIINCIKNNIKNYCKNVELVIFNGLDEKNKLLSFQKQMEIFRSGVLVIGPHGSALCNIIYMNPKNKRFICEFLYGYDSQDNCLSGAWCKSKTSKAWKYTLALDEKNYNYSSIPFTAKSDNKNTYINIEDLNTYLRKTLPNI